MKKAIVPALLTLSVLAASFAEPKLDAIDETIAKLKIGIQQLTDKGELGRAINKQIEDTEATMKKYQQKANDPGLPPKQRAYFEKLADNLDERLGVLYDTERKRYKAKTRMEEQLKLIDEDKEFIKNVIYLQEYKELFEKIEKLDVSHIKETFLEYRKKAADPSGSPRQRARYERLADDYETLLVRVDKWSKLLETP